MHLILNLGNPSKAVAQLLPALAAAEQIELPLTGVRLCRHGAVIVSTPVYGAGMTRDALFEIGTRFSSLSQLLLIGSMGSLAEGHISVGEFAAPVDCQCAYYGYAGQRIRPDEVLVELMSNYVRGRQGCIVRRYHHGSSFAVFDHNFDHSTYVSKIYDSEITGLDCGESFIGLKFAQDHKMRAAAFLYCSDDPSRKIGGIRADQFAALAKDYDVLLNEAAYSIFAGEGTG